MTSPGVTRTPQAPIEEAYAHMRRNNTRHLAIVSKDGTLLGIVTMTDLVSFGETTTLGGGNSSQPTARLGPGHIPKGQVNDDSV
jgi:hypothetical protein